MGSRCCTDRKPEPPKKVVEAPPQIKRKTACSVVGLGVRGGSRPSAMLGLKGRDAEKFDEAFLNMDVHGFTDLLSSTGTCEQAQLDEIPDHPWAVKPRSVGALAATQLAVIASADVDNAASIREAGAIKALVSFLQVRTSEDKRDAAVVLLVFLSSVDEESCQELGQKNVLPDLLRILGDKQQHRGLRAAISTVLVNVVLEHQGAASRFIREEGAVQLLSACDTVGCRDLQDEEPFLLEIVENMLELAEADEDNTSSKYLPGLRKAASANPHALSYLARKLPESEVEAAADRLVEKLS